MAKKKPASDHKEAVVTVKIRASLHVKARKIAGITGENLEDLLSDLLEDPLTKRLRKVLAEEQDALKDTDS